MRSTNKFKDLITALQAENIAVLEWTIYYESDENHFGEITAVGLDGNQIDEPDMFSEEGAYYGDDRDDDGWIGVLWALSDQYSDSGVFRLDIVNRTLQRVADAYVPESSDVELTDVDPVEYKFTILGTEDGIWDGPFHPTWSSEDPESPYIVQFWNDPNGFNPGHIWYARKYSSLGPQDKAQWRTDGENKYLEEAVARANNYYLEGDGSIYRNPDDEILLHKLGSDDKKGKTAARVLNAFGEEIYSINSKGKITDKRGPFKVEVQTYRKGFLKIPKGGWQPTGPKLPWNMDFHPNYNHEYDSAVVAIQMAKDLVKRNDSNQFKYHVRAIDAKGRGIGYLYQHGLNEYIRQYDATLHVRREAKNERAITLVELPPEVLIELANDVKNYNQWLWAVEFGKTFYGPKAIKIQIETESEYDDQGGYDDNVTAVIAYDEDDQVLSYDRELLTARLSSDPIWWSEVIKDYKHWVGDTDENNNPIDWNDPKLTSLEDEEFYEYIIDNHMEDIILDECNSLDAQGSAGDYFMSDPPLFDARWKKMRLFSVVDN